MRPRVVAVGLGPAGADLIVPAARAAIERIAPRYARTARHPAVDDLALAGIAFEPFDPLYDAAGDLDQAYDSIVEALLRAAAEHGEVLYAVPGSPTTAERTVAALRLADVDLEVVPGLSFADLAWARLGVDPLGGARVADAQRFDVDVAGHSGPLLIAQCDRPDLLSDVKLTLLEALPPEHPVVVLQRLGRPDEAVFDVSLAELDRSFEPDHLTSLFVDTGDVAIASEFARLVALAERLRGPGGCPWDAAQTHRSLRRHVVEEAYEVAAAIDALPADAPAGAEVPAGAYEHLADELGDLLFQVVIQSVLAGEAGAFTIADVSRGIHDKLVRRHPHVFGSVAVAGADEVVANWEEIKRQERGGSLVEGVALGLPALLRVHKLLGRAASLGVDPEGKLTPALAGVAERLAAVPDEAALAEVLVAAVAAARAGHVDAESVLAGWARGFERRLVRLERLAAERGLDLRSAGEATLRDLWAATAAERGPGGG